MEFPRSSSCHPLLEKPQAFEERAASPCPAETAGEDIKDSIWTLLLADSLPTSPFF